MAATKGYGSVPEGVTGLRDKRRLLWKQKVNERAMKTGMDARVSGTESWDRGLCLAPRVDPVSSDDSDLPCRHAVLPGKQLEGVQYRNEAVPARIRLRTSGAMSLEEKGN